MLRLLTLQIVVLAMSLAAARAEVLRFDVKVREAYDGGREQGERGPFERIAGVVRFALDPRLPANGIVVDLDLAPRNADGRVEFWADFEILLPAELSKANGAILYEVNNRGNRTAPNMFDGGADNFLLRQGFVVVWSGWSAEVLPNQEKFRFSAPAALDKDGEPLRGVVRQEVVVDRPVLRASLSHRGGQGCYRPSERGHKEAVLSIREREADPRQTIPRDQWELHVTDVTHDGKPWPLPLVELSVNGGLKPGWICEVVYEAEGAIVQGAGLVGIRDLVSYLKHDTTERNPLRTADGRLACSRALGFGTSQSGRLLRVFLHDGFNADEAGRQVFDGMMTHVAGGGLGSFNHRFAQPTRTNGQHEEHSYAVDVFPFSYGDSRDLLNSREDGILRRARATSTVPKVFHTQSSSEYWHRSGSLVHTDPQGREDAKLPAEVRLYTFGGTQHGPGSGVAGPRAGGVLPSNPADYRPFLRALLVALDRWVRDGTEPPPSVYPKIADGTLVDWHASGTLWPNVPGVPYPTCIQRPARMKRLTKEPPTVHGQYVVMVPVCDADGNERGVLRLPAIEAPVATYTSWNLRDESIGAAGELLALQGGYIPFARTKDERQAANDPRLSLAERYRDRTEFQMRYDAAAQALLKRGYLLEEDLPRLRALGEKLYP